MTTDLALLHNQFMETTQTETGKPITSEELLSYSDGTWVMTDHAVTRIIDTAFWTEPRPSGFLNGFWWRRKELMDEKGWTSQPGQ